MGTKSFQNLIEEVHDKGICQLCGGCVSFCSSAEYNVIEFKDNHKPPTYQNKENCLECGICYLICPQTHILDDDLNESYKFKDFSSTPIGDYIGVYSCQTNDSEFLQNGTDGGVVNTIINYLMEKKVIDGAIVSEVKAPFSREARYVDNKEDLLKTSGLKLNVSSQLNEIQKFNTYTNSIPKLNHYKFKKLAVVGTPCQIYTIRCMQNLGVTPSENIEICLGLFCYENFYFDKNQISKFENDFNIKFTAIESMKIKEDVIFKIRDINNRYKTVHLPFNHLNDYMRSACKACRDFTNIYADISFGGLGSPDKFTTVLVRTERGKKLLEDIINIGLIKSKMLNHKEKDNIIQLLSSYSSRKVSRMENYIKN